jgi:hypothetical protein
VHHSKIDLSRSGLGHERLGGASCRSSNVRNAPLATVGLKKTACREGPRTDIGWIGRPGETAPGEQNLLHSPPIRAPFSATERFINNTTNVAASIVTANQPRSRQPTAERRRIHSLQNLAAAAPRRVRHPDHRARMDLAIRMVRTLSARREGGPGREGRRRACARQAAIP